MKRSQRNQNCFESHTLLRRGTRKTLHPQKAFLEAGRKSNRSVISRCVRAFRLYGQQNGAHLRRALSGVHKEFITETREYDDE
jgi:hypothetical protein